MPSLDEPRVVTDDIKRILRRVVRPDDPDQGEQVAQLSDKAGTSTRTIYRILSGNYGSDMALDLGDRLALAAGDHLVHCRLRMPNGRVVNYLD